MKISAFFNLIRWKNLILIALMQILIKLFFLTDFGFSTVLTNTFFYLLVVSTTFITASGYIINDIFDVKTDRINKPTKIIISTKISLQTAHKLYLFLTVFGVLIGAYISFKIEKPFYSTFFIAIALLLYLYSKSLKGKMLIGNIVVSILLAFSIVILFLFDFPLPLNSLQMDNYFTLKSILFIYALFAFLLNFTREIIKDIEDIKGDYKSGLKTFPIVLGRNIARNFASFINLTTLLFLLFCLINFTEINSIAFVYIVSFIFLPLLYLSYRLWNAKNKKDYTILSKIIKIVILLGVLSIPLISNHLHNVIN